MRVREGDGEGVIEEEREWERGDVEREGRRGRNVEERVGEEKRGKD